MVGVRRSLKRQIKIMRQFKKEIVDQSSLNVLGFTMLLGAWIYKGDNQVFYAKYVNYNGPVPYLSLYIAHGKDLRPKSVNYGNPFKCHIGDYSSESKVMKRIAMYDVPTNRIRFPRVAGESIKLKTSQPD